MKLPSASEIAKLASEEPLLSKAKKRRAETDSEKHPAKNELQDAFRQGLERGFLRGFQQGKKEAIHEIVRRMLDNDCSTAHISNITGWSEDQISKSQQTNEE